VGYLEPPSRCSLKKLKGKDGSEEFRYVCPPENISLLLAKIPAKIIRKLLSIYPIQDFFNEMIIMSLASKDEDLRKFYAKIFEEKLEPLGEHAGKVVSKFLNSLWGGIPGLGTLIAIGNAADSLGEVGKIANQINSLGESDFAKRQKDIYRHMIILQAFTMGFMKVLDMSPGQTLAKFQDSPVFASLFVKGKDDESMQDVLNELEENPILDKITNDKDTKKKVIQAIQEAYDKLSKKYPTSVIEKLTGSSSLKTKLQPLNSTDPTDPDE
jgi:hypothetical protein